jgi:hypothetical protein
MKETALDKLKELVELDKITKIIYFSSKSIELDKESTFLLMQETLTEDLLPSLEFQGKDFKVIFDEEYKTLEYISLKKSLPEGPFKPISLTKTFEDEELGDVPFKTERYYRKQKAREIEEIKSLKGRIAKVIKRKEELALQEKITEEPFSIFTAGFYGDCYYILLPKDFKIPETGYYVDSEFLPEYLKDHVDYVGYSQMKFGRLDTFIRAGLKVDFYEKDTEEIVKLKETLEKEFIELVEFGMEEGKIRPVIGMSFRDYDDEEALRFSEEIVEFLKKSYK